MFGVVGHEAILIGRDTFDALTGGRAGAVVGGLLMFCAANAVGSALHVGD